MKEENDVKTGSSRAQVFVCDKSLECINRCLRYRLGMAVDLLLGDTSPWSLVVQLEKPGQCVIGDQMELLTPNKIMHAIEIRNAAIILCILVILPILVLISPYLFPF